MWVWFNNHHWAQLHSAQTKGFVTADVDGNGHAEVVIDFGAAGLWQFRNGASWSPIDGRSPEAIAVGDFDGR